MQAASVETLLGVERSRGDARLGLASSIEHGLSITALDRLAAFVAPEDSSFKFKLIAKATLARRKKSSSPRLTSGEGDRLARLATVISFAMDVFRDAAKVRAFLSRPHPMLDDKMPLDLALATGPGADAVLNVLGRAAYGGGV